MKTIYYAIGGGFGHARRAQRVLEALAIDADVITSDDVPRELEGNRDAHREWCIARFRGNRVLVDTFPCGIQGELANTEGTFDYVARILKWDEYRQAVPHDSPRFNTTYVVEELTKEHDQYIRAQSHRVTKLELRPPRATGNGSRATPYALIVHSGPKHEVNELIEYAKDLGPEPLLVATPCAIDGVERIDTASPIDFFPAATRIVTAAGFNVMLETEAWRDKHHILPFPRRFDDQFLRAARRRR